VQAVGASADALMPMRMLRPPLVFVCVGEPRHPRKTPKTICLEWTQWNKPIGALNSWCG
jgi:hypothetical protein